GSTVGFSLQMLAEITEPGSAVEDVDVPVDAHFHTGSVAPVAQILLLRRRCGSADTPESHQHHSTCRLILSCNRAQNSVRRNSFENNHCGGVRDWQKYIERTLAAAMERGNQMGTFLRGGSYLCHRPIGHGQR